MKRPRCVLLGLALISALMSAGSTAGAATPGRAAPAAPMVGACPARPIIAGSAAAASQGSASPAAIRQPVKPWIEQARLARLKAVNYFPVRHGWALMWAQWDPHTVDRDFGRIAALHANSVRIVLQAS